MGTPALPARANRLLAAKPGVTKQSRAWPGPQGNLKVPLPYHLGRIPGYPGAFLPVRPSVSISPCPYLEMEEWWLDQQQDWPVRTTYLRA